MKPEITMTSESEASDERLREKVMMRCITPIFYAAPSHGDIIFDLSTTAF